MKARLKELIAASGTSYNRLQFRAEMFVFASPGGRSVALVKLDRSQGTSRRLIRNLSEAPTGERGRAAVAPAELLLPRLNVTGIPNWNG